MIDPNQDLENINAEYGPAINPKWVSNIAREANSGLSFGLSDKFDALRDAAADKLAGALTGKPEPQSFVDLYHKKLQDTRQQSAGFVETNPAASWGAYGAGTVGSALALSGARAATTLGRVLQTAGTGAGVGAASGFGHTNDESLGGDLIATGTGAGVGAVTGGTLGLAGDRVVSPVMNWFARRFSPEAADSQAVKLIANRMQQDTKAGGPTAQDMLDLLNAAPDKPQALVDVAGENARRLGGTIARGGGEGGQFATKALETRDLGAGRRLAEDVNQGISAGGSAHSTTEALMQARSAASTPAYERAGIPSDPRRYASAPVVDNPAVARLLEKSQDVQSAIRQAKGHPDYADLPDNSMVLLDKAYKNIGGSANEAKVAGNGEKYRDLNNLRIQLRDAITGGDANHPYQAALDTYSGPSSSIAAVREGRAIFTKHPDEIASDMATVSPNDREFYKLGAADAVRKEVARTGMGGDESKKIIGNQYVQDQLRPIFDTQKDFDRFIGSVTAENRMFGTGVKLKGGAQTAERLSEDLPGGSEAGGHAMRAVASVAAGEPVGGSLSGLKALGALFRGDSRSPEVNAAASRILFHPSSPTDPKIISDLARIYAAQNVRRGPPLLTAPSSAALGATYPNLTSLPFMPQGGGQ